MKKRRAIVKKIILYIVLILMVIASLFPIIFCLSASLRTQEDLFKHMFPFSMKSLIPSQVTFDNYIIIFSKYNFLRPILNTMIVTVFTIFFGCLLNAIAAFAITCFDFKGKRVVYILILYYSPIESAAA